MMARLSARRFMFGTRSWENHALGASITPIGGRNIPSRKWKRPCAAGLPLRDVSIGQSLLERAAAHLNSGHVTGWYQGRCEWGPRALGNRSILAHPGWPGMKDLINQKIKRREVVPSVRAINSGG